MTAGCAGRVGSMHLAHRTGEQMRELHRDDELALAEGQEMQHLHDARTER
jgi:hypothetical protein